MTHTAQDYSILVPFSGNEDFLRVCLESLNGAVPSGVEIILISNKRIPITSWLEAGKFIIVESEDQLVYPQAINLGAAHSKGKFLIFCDSDICVLPGWFEKLTQFYHSTLGIGIASSKLINPYSGRIIDFGIGFTQYNSPHIGRDRPFDFPSVIVSHKVQAACSANMMMS